MAVEATSSMKAIVIQKCPATVETTATMKPSVAVEATSMSMAVEIKKDIRIDIWPVRIVGRAIIIIIRVGVVIRIVVIGHATTANHY
jgi:hypothetical protein